MIKALKGLTTLEEVLRITQHDMMHRRRGRGPRQPTAAATDRGPDAEGDGRDVARPSPRRTGGLPAEPATAVAGTRVEPDASQGASDA